jgi:hypothetical protein
VVASLHSVGGWVGGWVGCLLYIYAVYSLIVLHRPHPQDRNALDAVSLYSSRCIQRERCMEWHQWLWHCGRVCDSATWMFEDSCIVHMCIVRQRASSEASSDY